MVSALPLDEFRIARAAEEMIAEYRDEALSDADDQINVQINALKSQSFDSIAKTWELIREATKDGQRSDDKSVGIRPSIRILVGGKE